MDGLFVNGHKFLSNKIHHNYFQIYVTVDVEYTIFDNKHAV